MTATRRLVIQCVLWTAVAILLVVTLMFAMSGCAALDALWAAPPPVDGIRPPDPTGVALGFLEAFGPLLAAAGIPGVGGLAAAWAALRQRNGRRTAEAERDQIATVQTATVKIVDALKALAPGTSAKLKIVVPQVLAGMNLAKATYDAAIGPLRSPPESPVS